MQREGYCGTGLFIRNRGQMTNTTAEPTSPCPDILVTPTEGRLTNDRLFYHAPYPHKRLILRNNRVRTLPPVDAILTELSAVLDVKLAFSLGDIEVSCEGGVSSQMASRSPAKVAFSQMASRLQKSNFTADEAIS
ncbi:hypothetical protein AVEN_93135-1 [Araneus ventricosus]|uniref:Uncharacterized protein n=1 Tax=Araneus ventricosus TaxID=182803 RepID=A0A4Y2IIF7_ARAVE|nr:hypothetical protein AVEN_93135-1 [Araneus ventricosus]